MANSRYIKIIQWNCQGAIGKQNAIVHAVKTENLDICLLQDTRIKIKPDNKLPIKICGYNTFFIPHAPGESPGLITFIKKSIPVENYQLPPLGDHTHTLSIKIFINQTPYLIHNIYRVSGITQLDPLFTNPTPSIIAGDFNCHHTSWGSTTDSLFGKRLYKYIQESPEYLLIKPLSPTRGNNYLDLAIIHKDKYLDTIWDVNYSFYSDHKAVQLTIAFNNLNKPTTSSFKPKWIIDQANWVGFQSELKDQNLSSPDLDIETDSITKDIIQAATKHIPRTKPKKRRNDNWYSNFYISGLKNKLNYQQKRLKHRDIHITKENVQSTALEYASSCTIARNQSWDRWVTEVNYTTNTKIIWDRIKRCRGNNNQITLHPNPLDNSTLLCTQFKDRCKTNNLPASTINKLNNLYNDRTNTINVNITTPSGTDRPFNTFELHQAISTRTKDSAPGSDTITYSIIKHLPDCTMQRLLKLFNLSYTESRVPTTWKTANLIPIPKPGKPGEYRPISLLSCISKILEIMILNRIKHIAQSLHYNAFGFKSGYGTNDAIATFISDITRTSKPNLAVFIDLEKAFELANSTVILNNLAKRGVRGRLLAWLKDYLTNRSATLTFKGAQSQPQQFENGTPQGSSLSPTLFNYLIDELMQTKLPKNVKLLAYADDLVLYTIIDNIHQSKTRLQLALNSISDLISSLGLKISTEKTKSLAINCGREAIGNLILNNTPLEWTDSCKYLGLIVDKSLTFRPHINYTRSRAEKKIDTMKVMSSLSGVNSNILKRFYIQGIAPILDYGAPALVHSGKTNFNQLQIVQNSASRIILGQPKFSRTATMSQELILQSVQSRHNVRNSKFTHKILCNALHPLHHNATAGIRLAPQIFQDFKSGLNRMITSYRNLKPLFYIPDTTKRYEHPPWQELPFVTIIHKPFRNKASVPTEVLLQTHLTQINSLSENNMQTYYTDGSKNENGVGSAFWSTHHEATFRLNTEASILQAELIAIKKALINSDPNNATIVHTDSLTSIQALTKKDNTNNIPLINDIIHICLGHTSKPIINWVPSHVGIPGNEKADQLANLAALKNGVEIVLPPSQEFVNKYMKRTAFDIWETCNQTNPGSAILHNKLLNSSAIQKYIGTLLDRNIQKDIYTIRLGTKSLHLLSTRPHLATTAMKLLSPTNLKPSITQPTALQHTLTA